ncbi:MAG: class I SAM-dependent methyltransferase [Desulfobacterales bacterium]
MPPIVNDAEDCFRRLVPATDPLLSELEAEAAAEGIPIVGPLVGALLEVLAAGAANVLELGAAAGYATIHLARGCRGRVTAVERDAGLAARARRNLVRAGFADRVEVVCAEALSWLGECRTAFDFVFFDIEKADYAPALAACSPLVRPGGLLVADNTAFPEAALFNEAVHGDPAWKAVSLLCFLPGHSPEKDGLCIARRR